MPGFRMQCCAIELALDLHSPRPRCKQTKCRLRFSKTQVVERNSFAPKSQHLQLEHMGNRMILKSARRCQMICIRVSAFCVCQSHRGPRAEQTSDKETQNESRRYIKIEGAHKTQ